MPTQDFDYNLFLISSAILAWAEAKILTPGNNEEYYEASVLKAFSQIDDIKTSWEPIYKTYQGKNRDKIGKCAVGVQMGNGQKITTLYHKIHADEIFRLLFNIRQTQTFDK